MAGGPVCGLLRVVLPWCLLPASYPGGVLCGLDGRKVSARVCCRGLPFPVSPESLCRKGKRRRRRSRRKRQGGGCQLVKLPVTRIEKDAKLLRTALLLPAPHFSLSSCCCYHYYCCCCCSSSFLFPYIFSPPRAIYNTAYPSLCSPAHPRKLFSVLFFF